jgi:cytochrome P450
MSGVRLDEIDLTDLDRFANGFPHDVFTVLRHDAPVWWHEADGAHPDGEGFWSVHTHAECMAVVHDPESFSSETGGNRPFGGTIIPDLPVAGQMLNMMDDPRHQRVRLLVSKGLSPRTITRLEADLAGAAAQLVDGRARRGRVRLHDRGRGRASEQAICILLGIPEHDRHRLSGGSSTASTSGGDREAFETTDDVAQPRRSMFEYGTRSSPRNARIPPTTCSPSCATRRCRRGSAAAHRSGAAVLLQLLWAAGPTRPATRSPARSSRSPSSRISSQCCGRHRRDARRDRGDRAVDASRRVQPADRDRTVELGGQTIRAGDKVVFWEASANRDELVFDEPFRFDVRRQPNPHLGFGHGIHHCLGANLARLEIRVVHDRAARDASTRSSSAGAVEWTRSNKHTGIRRLPVTLNAALSRV